MNHNQYPLKSNPVWIHSKGNEDIQGPRSSLVCLKNYGQKSVIQEAVNKTIPKKKKSKKAKRLFEEALQIAEEWREVKSKGERERYTK